MVTVICSPCLNTENLSTKNPGGDCLPCPSGSDGPEKDWSYTYRSSQWLQSRRNQGKIAPIPQILGETLTLFQSKLADYAPPLGFSDLPTALQLQSRVIQTQIAMLIGSSCLWGFAEWLTATAQKRHANLSCSLFKHLSMSFIHFTYHTWYLCSTDEMSIAFFLIGKSTSKQKQNMLRLDGLWSCFW